MGPRPFGRGRDRLGARQEAEARASMGPRPFGRGRHRQPERQLWLRRASMGPRPFGRGRAANPTSNFPVQSFNGAATFRSRKVPPDVAPRPHPRGFNGAATFRSRKGRDRRRAALAWAPLQWGRDLSVAEGCRQTLGGDRQRPASMGPRPFGRGRGPTELSALGLGTLQWGRDLSVAEGVSARTRRARREKLQWGRDLSVAEGRKRHTKSSFPTSFNGAATFRSRKAASQYPPPRQG